MSLQNLFSSAFGQSCTLSLVSILLHFWQYLSNACDIHYIFLRYRIYQHAADNHERSNIFRAIRNIKHQYSIGRLVSSFKNLYIYQFMWHLMPGLTSIEEAAKNTDGSQTKLRLLHESMDTRGWGGGNFTVRIA